MNGSEQSGSKPTFKQLQDALEKSTTRSSRQLLSFLLIQLYLLITVAATTDLQLLLPDSKVTLPLLNVELSLFGFFAVAPALVFTLHYIYLIYLRHHDKILNDWNRLASKEQKVLLPGFIFNYSIIYGKSTFTYGLLRFLHGLILSYFPLVLIVIMQFRFADYHDSYMTSWHFMVILLDLVLPCTLWIVIAYPKASRKANDGLMRGIVYLGLIVISIFSALLLLVVILINSSIITQSKFYIPRISVPWETLVEPPSDIIIHAYLLEEKSLDSAWLEYGQGIDLSGRDLQFANFHKADLRMVSLEGSNLNGCILDSANLNNANLINAKLNHASLQVVSMKHALADSAQFNFSDLWEANLNGIRLNHASLNGAIITCAFVNGAQLKSCSLVAADLSNSQFNFSNLNYSILKCASMVETQLVCAELREVRLDGADLENTILFGANLSSAKLNGAFTKGTKVSSSFPSSTTELKGIYPMFKFDTISSPDWDSLKIAIETNSEWGLSDQQRKDFIERIEKARNQSHSVDPIFGQLAYDSTGFIEVRQKLSCQSTYGAKNMIMQSLFPDSLKVQFRNNILHYMHQNCPDILAAIQPLLSEELSSKIDSIMQGLK